MEKHIEKRIVKVIGLSYGSSAKEYVTLVLGVEDTDIKIPIIIKESDALNIMMKIEGIKPKRPITHDVVKNITDNLLADLFEVNITSIVEGVFLSYLNFCTMEDEFEVETTIGDAICFSMAYDCNLWCSQEVIDMVGIHMDDEGNISSRQEDLNKRDRKMLSDGNPVENLEIALKKAIENEEYEIASQLRDRISELKK
jgi:bifunctional DNase/RNase